LHPPDHELLRRASKGDEAAFHELVDRYAGQLYAVAYSVLGNSADAEDVVQETFTGAFKGLAGFRGQASVKTWLLRILMRQAAYSRRRMKLRPALFEDPETMVAPRSELAAPSAMLDVDRHVDVRAMLETLSREHREVMVLREFEGLSYEEMAQALGIPRGTVESRLHRARQELRERFKEYL
jgi:RNA polymerase sigma-70 factor (ECF subfamily)